MPRGGPLCEYRRSYELSLIHILKPLLMKQVSSSVRWEQTIRKMLADGVDTFIEIGPGKTLTGFMRKIDKNAKAFNIEKLEDIDKVKEALGC